MTGLWMPAMLEDGNGNVPKGQEIFVDAISNDNTHILHQVSTVKNGSTAMEAESDAAQGCPHYPCDTDMMTTNYRHRRHYAVRRKLGRAKTARLAAPASLASDAGDGNAITLAGIEGGAEPSDGDGDGEVKCDLNDSAECDNEDDESIGESEDAEDSATDDEDTSADVDDEEDENQTGVDESEDDDDGDVSPSTACASSRSFHGECVVSQLLTDRRIVQRFNRPVPVITVVDQPGPSTEETFFDYASETLSTPLLYPLDERDSITPHYFTTTRKNNPGEVVIQSENGERRVLRSTPDWTEEAINGDHLWVPTSASGDLCHVLDQDCTRGGPRMKCSGCRIVAHISCIPQMKFLCRPTFWDGDLRQYRENTTTTHHWVHRRSQTGKCQNCSKSFQSKLSFGSKEILAISCSWCKAAYHNKENCFNMDRLKEPCSLAHQTVIVPPSWIVKLPARENFKSSLRKSPRSKKDRGSSRRSKRVGGVEKPEQVEKESYTGSGGFRSFVVKPIPMAGSRPIIVFINPKSGGNQGAKLMQKFQWLLNPRQVFDLTQGGPRAGLEMFRKVPNLRVLACGGDGTAGWVLSILDQIDISPAPPVGVLPLGTGNDLARALGWGGGYTDEPISKILTSMGEAEPVMLDRWELQVEKNPDAPPSADDSGNHHPSRDTLPLSVVNNYFSFGVDAQIALDFHEAREAHPQKFNSRLRNKMFYGQAGGKDLLQRKWKDLSEFVTLECDGKDITAKLREQKVHAVLFLNIPSYGGGTHPWNRAHGQEAATDDGLIEVVGLKTYQLPLLQAGGHGTCLAQCRTARIVTRRTIPVQVDGEACRLNPSIIGLQLLNQAPVLAKRRAGFEPNPAPVVEQLKMQVKRISMADYEAHHYDKENLQASATPLGTISVSHDAVLEHVRKLVNNLLEQQAVGTSSSPVGPHGGGSPPTNGGDVDKLCPDWCFIDCCTAERVFRVDSGQEHLHYITDISTDCLYILDPVSAADTESLGLESGPNGASNLLDEAGLEDMVNLANSQLQQELRHSDKMERKNITEKAEDVSPQPPENVVVHDNFLVPINVKSVYGDKLPIFCPRKSPLLEKSSSSIVKAAKDGDLKKLKDLHASGYSLLSIDAQGQTALHWAARHGHRDVIKYLLASSPSALLDMVDNEKGQTALHKAALAKQRAISCMLVAAGASMSLVDKERHTPRNLAERAGDADLAIYLASQENFHKNAADNVETSV
ncbi:eye-specific diacylglycerol kinase-like isoform X3 [Daphnia carinata]|uniref:eye-specific diacylglycerol kinase-like isoform X3 n=1 Tax=Daphnia carinata TaxID=120202 RepID=UPI00257B8359|nr:eye-specific diacylglycerol kinase-like isoform X3 [Daphnia carinata]XP_057365191.1 eye-specific diacylglycerol kinase-like isoform X3 [Daphnia carinata]